MPVTKDHTLAFGAIAHWYANAESFLKFTIAGLIKADVTDVVILTAPYQATQLINVIKSLAKERPLDDESANSLLEIISAFKSMGKIRNLIAHSRWADGEREGSIRPTNADIRAGKLVFSGSASSKDRDWTAPELQEEAAKIQSLCFDIVAWMFAEGMLSKDLISSLMESSDGIPTKQS